jgi:hypothetical protein
VPGLLGAEQAAGATDLQVLHRHRHAGTQLGVLRDGGQPVVRGLGERRFRRVEEVGVPALPATPDPAAQLVQLSQTEQVAALDDQRVGVGDVQPGLDDRGAHQDVVLALPEALDELLELVLVQLPVRGDDPRLGDELPEPPGRLLDRRHPVVHVEDLPVAQQLAADRGGDLLVVVAADVGQDRVPVLGRGEDRRHLADPGEAHLQRARDRGGRHGQHVDVGAQRLDVFLVLDAEALLLVDDDQAEILVPHTCLK